MPNPELLIGLLIAIAALARLAGALNVPYPVLLVLGGLIIGVVPGIPHVQLKPSLVLLIFLPPLVYQAAFLTSPRQLRQQAKGIGALAVGLVLATMSAVAVVAHTLLGTTSWPEAFVLGAVVAPTDPIAATAIFGRLGAPSRLIALVEGEALINDGTALVAFRVAAGAITGASISASHALAQFVEAAAGGVAIGVVVGWIVRRVRGRAGEPSVEITLSLLTPYLSYIPAERLGFSGVLAAVSTGIYLAYAAPAGVFAPGTRLQGYAFWEVLEFLLNSVLFILVGLEVRPIMNGMHDRSPGSLAVAAVVVVGTVLVCRLVWLAGSPLCASLRERVVVSWSGMRGAVSMAAALSVPLAAPARPMIIYLTFMVILVTLVGQGLTLPLLVRGVVSGEEREHRRAVEQEARAEAARGALDLLDELEADEDLPETAVEQARRRYELRLSHFSEEGDGDGLPSARGVQRRLVEVERETFERLYAEGKLDRETVQRLSRELDLQEQRWMELEQSPLSAERG